MDDQPNTQAEPVRAAALVVSTKDWDDRGFGYGTNTAYRVPVLAIDFYREDKTQ